MLSINDSQPSVGTNLWDALVQLRRPDASVRIWANALCINQDDLDERSRHVHSMGQIYAGAEEVLIWLGKARGSSETLKDVCDLVANSARLTLGERRSKLPALWDSFSRSWFSRLWVLQEAALAPKATLVLGDERCDLGIFRLVIWDDVRAALNESQEVKLHIVEGNTTLNVLNVFNLVHLLDCQIHHNPNSYEQLVYDCMMRACSDPRDHLSPAYVNVIMKGEVM